MATFQYVARNARGAQVSGTTEAPSQAIAARTLREQGLTPSQILEARPKAAARSRGRRGRIKLDDMVIFSRQLAVMIRAGLPLIEVLNILSEQMEKRSFRNVVSRVERDVEAGASFTEALQRHPAVFNPFFISMVRAGEAAGMLDTILDQVASYLEKTASLQRKVKSAMVYPCTVMVFAAGITTFLMVYIVPIFSQIFSDLGGNLPRMTRVTIFISNLLIHKGIFILLGIVALIVGLRYWGKTRTGREVIDRTKLRLPILGSLLLKSGVARFTRTLGVLLRAGVNILSALDIVGRTSGNVIIENAIYKTKMSIQSGESISKPLQESNVFPPMVTRMISVGERTGNLESMLQKIADFYEDQVDATVNALTSLLEPLMIICLGVIIGFIVISMFLPLFAMLEYLT